MVNLRVAYFHLPIFSYMYFHPEEFGLDKELIKQSETKVKYRDAIPGDMIGYKIPSEQDEKMKRIERDCNNMRSGTFETLLLYLKYNSKFLKNIQFMMLSIFKK